MIIFDSLRRFSPSGSGFSIENKKIKCTQKCLLKNYIDLTNGDHNVRIQGYRNSGNGLVKFLVENDKNETMFEKTLVFHNKSPALESFLFTINNPGNYSFKLIRDKDSLGTIYIDSVRFYFNSTKPNIIEKEELKLRAAIDSDYFLIIEGTSAKPDLVDRFISENNISSNKFKLLTIYSDNFYKKNYSSSFDTRVFETTLDMIEFINISEAKEVILLSEEDIFKNIDSELSIPLKKYKEIIGKVEQKKEVKCILYKLDGIFL